MISVTTLPFNKLVGLQRGGELPSLTLPGGEQYLNHLGTVHAAALLTLAEAASGEFLLAHLGSTEGLVPVVRRLEAKFRKPAHGEVKSSVSTPLESLRDMKETVQAKGRALIDVTVELHDQAGTHVLSATVEWFVVRASQT